MISKEYFLKGFFTMRITALVGCTRNCVYQKDGFCRADKSNIKSIMNIPYGNNIYSVEYGDCAYYKRNRSNGSIIRSNSKLEAYFC